MSVQIEEREREFNPLLNRPKCDAPFSNDIVENKEEISMSSFLFTLRLFTFTHKRYKYVSSFSKYQYFKCDVRFQWKNGCIR